MIEESYEQCRAIVRARGKNFYAAGRLVPERERNALFAVYAFARHVDDIVDEPPPSWTKADIEHALDDAMRELDRTLQGRPPAGFWPALADTAERFSLSRVYFADLVEGMRQDLHGAEFDTYADLALYLYRAAGTVGFLVGEIMGDPARRDAKSTRSLGEAFQLTNVIRDIGEDHARGRTYLPREDLERFGVPREELGRPTASARLRRLVAFETTRAHALYAAGMPFLDTLRVGRPAVAAGTAIYRAHLELIERQRYDVLVRRPSLGTASRISAALGGLVRSTGRAAILGRIG